MSPTPVASGGNLCRKCKRRSAGWEGGHGGDGEAASLPRPGWGCPGAAARRLRGPARALQHGEGEGRWPPSRAVPAPRRVPGPVILFHFAWLKAGRPPRPGGRAEAAAGCAAAPARQAPEVTAPGARPLPGAGPASLPHRSGHSPPPAPPRVPCKVEGGQEKEVWPRFLFLNFGGGGTARYLDSGTLCTCRRTGRCAGRRCAGHGRC